jgi:hypothetical protein
MPSQELWVKLHHLTIQAFGRGRSTWSFRHAARIVDCRCGDLRRSAQSVSDHLNWPRECVKRIYRANLTCSHLCLKRRIYTCVSTKSSAGKVISDLVWVSLSKEWNSITILSRSRFLVVVQDWRTCNSGSTVTQSGAVDSWFQKVPNLSKWSQRF